MIFSSTFTYDNSFYYFPLDFLSLDFPADQTPYLLVQFRQILPALKLWAEWMLRNESIWNPPPTSRDPILGMVLFLLVIF